MATTIKKEWNGVLIEAVNTASRMELRIDGRTVDFVEGMRLKKGVNDYLHGYAGKDHIEIRIEPTPFSLSALFTKGTMTAHFFYNGREIYKDDFSFF